jgi:hypothetical protein
LQEIAFDADIPTKFKVPFCIYFRNDSKSTDDSIAMSDYFQWIAETLREHVNYVSQLPQYIYQNDLSLELYHCNFPSSLVRRKEHKVSLAFETSQRE